MKNRKFISLYETIYDRYKQGAGFLQGDVVKLKSNYKSTEGYKTLSEMLKQRLDDAEKSGYNLRIGRLHTPQTNAGSLGINVGLPATHADLYQEPSPGSFGNLVTIPIDLIEYIDTGVNLPEVSAKSKRPNKSYIKPGKWKSNKDEPETKEQNRVGHEQNWVKKGDYKLAEKNVKPSVGGNKYDDEKPSKFDPLKGNKKLTKESVNLESIYTQMFTEDATNDVDPQGYSMPAECRVKGREVNVSSLEVDGVDSRDYPDFSDAYISSGYFADGTPMSNDELELFNSQYSDIAQELALDRLAGQGDVFELNDIDEADVAPNSSGSRLAGEVNPNPEDREQTSALEAKNHMGDRLFQTYAGWKRACKLIKPDAKFNGDRDIDSCEVGEWDGAEGSVYNTSED